MMKMKKTLALLLAAAMTVGILSGCSGSKETETPAPEAPEASVQVEAVDLSKITNPAEYVSGLAPDTVVATVGGSEITVDMLMYWFNYSVTYTMQQYSYMGVSTVDWRSDMGDGVTVADGILATALELAAYYAVLPGNAAEKFGLEPDPAELEALETDMKAAEEQLGSPEKAEHFLWMNMTTADLYRELVSTASIEVQLQEKVFGKGGALEPTDAEVLAFATEELGYYGAKHILLMNVDTNQPIADEAGNVTGFAPLDEKAVAEKKALAEDILAQLDAAADPVALFDTLMHEYSEDTGLASYPDGYTAYPGQMVTAFEQAAMALKDGEISPIVESEYGYHIILRTPLEPDQFMNQYVTYQVDALAREWLEEGNMTTNEAYDSIDAAGAVDKMLAMQEAAYNELFPEGVQAAEGETETAE